MTTWLPLIYQFLIGGIIFFIGIVIPWRKGDYSWNKREDRLTLVYMILGFFLYLTLQTLWTLYAIGKI